MRGADLSTRWGPSRPNFWHAFIPRPRCCAGLQLHYDPCGAYTLCAGFDRRIVVPRSAGNERRCRTSYFRGQGSCEIAERTHRRSGFAFVEVCRVRADRDHRGPEWLESGVGRACEPRGPGATRSGPATQKMDSCGPGRSIMRGSATAVRVPSADLSTDMSREPPDIRTRSDASPTLADGERALLVEYLAVRGRAARCLGWRYGLPRAWVRPLPLTRESARHRGVGTTAQGEESRLVTIKRGGRDSVHVGTHRHRV